MTFLLNTLAFITALGESVYLHSILSGSTERTELELIQAFDHLSTNEKKGNLNKIRVWIVFFISLLFQAIYLYIAYLSINNLLFDVFTSCTIGVETYCVLCNFRSISRYLSGNGTIQEVFSWKTERISCIVMFTHAILVLLYPMALWL